MTRERADAYRGFMKYWQDNLHELHPQTILQKRRPNAHAAFHIFDFLLLFGPIMSWWCFPFERLIGLLQKINTNDQVGGKSVHVLLMDVYR
ncbi:hypothetical protein C8J57DRAFT_1076562 [Mycena rebaudengoi]|nr:hypothetical protein C8J57DRAFT_1084399 [Mycena rebaudengoi]KAJ7253835.1 hypothetical protein C8J57DRAFT_1076562 [Mycena rebaudengoi]